MSRHFWGYSLQKSRNQFWYLKSFWAIVTFGFAVFAYQWWDRRFFDFVAEAALSEVGKALDEEPSVASSQTLSGTGLPGVLPEVVHLIEMIDGLVKEQHRNLNQEFREKSMWAHGLAAIFKGLSVDESSYFCSNKSIQNKENCLNYSPENLARAVSLAARLSERSLLEETEIFVKAAVGSLDPHSSYLNRKAYAELLQSTSGQFAGFGVNLNSNDGLLRVSKVLKGSFAFQQGVREGDLLYAVGQVPVLFDSPEEVVSRIRGNMSRNRAENLYFYDETKAVTKAVAMQRDAVSVASIETTQIFGVHPVLLIKIKNFSNQLVQDVKFAIESAQLSEPHLYGIVIDVRDNPGGILEQAVGLADLFLDSGTLLNMRSKKDLQIFKVTEGSKIDLPLVVLINAQSASASEVLTAALKDNHRAVVIGERSFGKASIQSVFELPFGSAIKLTTAIYETPNGSTINGNGIAPHLWIKNFLKKDNLVVTTPLSLSQREDSVLQNFYGTQTSNDEINLLQTVQTIVESQSPSVLLQQKARVGEEFQSKQGLLSVSLFPEAGREDIVTSHEFIGNDQVLQEALSAFEQVLFKESGYLDEDAIKNHALQRWQITNRIAYGGQPEDQLHFGESLGLFPWQGDKIFSALSLLKKENVLNKKSWWGYGTSDGVTFWTNKVSKENLDTPYFYDAPQSFHEFLSLNQRPGHSHISVHKKDRAEMSSEFVGFKQDKFLDLIRVCKNQEFSEFSKNRCSVSYVINNNEEGNRNSIRFQVKLPDVFEGAHVEPFVISNRDIRINELASSLNPIANKDFIGSEKEFILESLQVPLLTHAEAEDDSHLGGFLGFVVKSEQGHILAKIPVALIERESKQWHWKPVTQESVLTLSSSSSLFINK